MNKKTEVTKIIDHALKFETLKPKRMILIKNYTKKCTNTKG